jgi:superoxide dismutase, Fe-Mn family
MKRSNFLKTIFAGVLASKIDISKAENPANAIDVFTLPKLKYAYSDLEPHIDAATMEIHHSKHHQAYITNLNKAIENKPEASLGLEMLIKNISKYSTAVRNNGGGHWNHSFFWEVIGPKKTNPSSSFLAQIDKDLGGFEKFKSDFAAAAMTRFGSGWAWLIISEGKLKITSTPNQDNPLMDLAEVKGIPLLGLDVWEHAYYLKYQNKRADYIKAFWEIVNWEQVEKNLKKA